MSLRAYSTEQLQTGESLPARISSIAHEVGVAEGKRVEYMLAEAGSLASEIKAVTNRDFHYLGSIAMYAHLSQHRGSEGSHLQILEHRIAGGKNDFDVAFSVQDYLGGVMDEFGWDEEAKRLSRGKVGSSTVMVDLMGRDRLPSFPPETVTYEGQEIPAQNVEELLFEKVQALVDPGSDDSGTTRGREIKWGVDIKIIKAHLLMLQREEDPGYSEDQLDAYLSGRWLVYQKEKREAELSWSEGTISSLEEKIKGGTSVHDVLAEAVSQQLDVPIEEVKQDLLKSVAAILDGDEALAQRLVDVTADGFRALMREVLERRMPAPISYEEAMRRAEEEYAKLLEE